VVCTWLRRVIQHLVELPIEILNSPMPDYALARSGRCEMLESPTRYLVVYLEGPVAAQQPVVQVAFSRLPMAIGEGVVQDADSRSSFTEILER
jgi:hypothetical protein